MAICHGPVDEIQEILVGERSAWNNNITSSTRIFINEPNLFGGEKKEGGIQGNVDVEFGQDDQGKNSYLMSQLGENIPSFRGILSLVLNQCYVTAMTRTPKPWWVRVKRAAARDWYAGTAEIAGNADIPGGSANGAHIIYEALTNVDWGMGLSSAFIDDPSFRAAADILFAENFGLSLLLSRQTTSEEFIQNILSHINGVLYTDRQNGRFNLKLIREPTQSELDNAVVINDNNIIEMTRFQRVSFAEMANEIIIRFRPQGSDQDKSLTFQDLSSIQAQRSTISQTIDLVGVDNETIASRIGERELRQASTPLAKLTVTVNRDGWNINIGDVIKYSNPRLGINEMVMRVFAIDYGTLENGEIRIEATEDVFSLPTTSYLVNQASEWSDPIRAPEPAEDQIAKELTYWDIQRNFRPGDISALVEDSGYAHMIVTEPVGISTTNYQFWTNNGSGAAFTLEEELAYIPKATVPLSISKTDTTISASSLPSSIDEINIGTYAYIGDEIVRIDAIRTTTNQIDIGRGCLDTVPAEHGINSSIFFAEEFDSYSDTEYLLSDSLDTKSRVLTDIGLLSLADAPTVTLNFAGRKDRPYAPGRFRINGTEYPELIIGVDTTITWAHRDRTQQLATIIDTQAENIGPETGATYTVRIKNNAGTTLHTETGITDTTYTYPLTSQITDNGSISPALTVELETVVGSRTSYQFHEHNFAQVPNPIRGTTDTQNLMFSAMNLQVPTGAAAGDTLLAVIRFRADRTFTIPTGWSSILDIAIPASSSSTADSRVVILQKPWVNESTVSFVGASTGEGSVVLFLIRGEVRTPVSSYTSPASYTKTQESSYTLALTLDNNHNPIIASTSRIDGYTNLAHSFFTGAGGNQFYTIFADSRRFDQPGSISIDTDWPGTTASQRAIVVMEIRQPIPRVGYQFEGNYTPPASNAVNLQFTV